MGVACCCCCAPNENVEVGAALVAVAGAPNPPAVEVAGAAAPNENELVGAVEAVVEVTGVPKEKEVVPAVEAAGVLNPPAAGLLKPPNPKVWQYIRLFVRFTKKPAQK